MDLLGEMWRLLPTPLRTRIRAVLASRGIGRLPEARPPEGPTPPEPLGPLVEAPTEMSLDERLFLYALVRGTAPRRVLEIGTSQGGSAWIIASALEENGVGELAGIEPLPRIELPFSAFHGRFQLVQGTSPEVVPEASRRLGGPFDLVLVDGIHVYEHAALDIRASLAHMSPTGYLLFHDAFHFGVSEAIREAIEREPDLYDCGYVCARPRRVGDLLTHAGLRLVRRGPPTVDINPLVAGVWTEVGSLPPHDPDLRNHDIWYCEAIRPCAYCQRQGLTAE